MKPDEGLEAPQGWATLRGGGAMRDQPSAIGTERPPAVAMAVLSLLEVLR
jgi:hypothetical protein